MLLHFVIFSHVLPIFHNILESSMLNVWTYKNIDGNVTC